MRICHLPLVMWVVSDVLVRLVARAHHCCFSRLSLAFHWFVTSTWLRPILKADVVTNIPIDEDRNTRIWVPRTRSLSSALNTRFHEGFVRSSVEGSRCPVTWKFEDSGCASHYVVCWVTEPSCIITSGCLSLLDCSEL